MACIVMAYVVMAYIVMAYIVMAYVVMAYIVMAYTVMACSFQPNLIASLSPGSLQDATVDPYGYSYGPIHLWAKCSDGATQLWLYI